MGPHPTGTFISEQHYKIARNTINSNLLDPPVMPDSLNTVCPDHLRLDQQLCFPLYAASNLMTRLYRPLLDELGLTYPQYLAMLVLWEASPSTVSALGERLLLDSGTLTPLLKRLESAGLVCRTRDAADERRVLVSLTAEGLALRSRAEGVPHRLVCRVLGEAEQSEGLSTETPAAPLAAPLADAVALRSQLQALVHTLSHALDTQGTPSKQPAGA